MIICSIMALNMGVMTAFASGPGGGAESLAGHGPSDIITSTGSSNTNVQAGNGQAVVEMGGTSLPQSSSKTPKNSSSQKNTNKKPSTRKKTNKKSSTRKKTNPGTTRANTGGSNTSKKQIVTPPEWHITEGWVWSLSEWGKRNDWFTANKDGNIIDRIKTIFWGDKEPETKPGETKPGETKTETTYDVSETSYVSNTNVRKNRRLVRYDWTITNTTDSSLPVEYAKTPSLTLKWVAKYTGKYNAVAKPWCRWDVGYETTRTVTITGSDGSVSTSTHTVFHKTGEEENYYTPGIREFNFTIGLKDIGKETELPPKDQITVEAIDELVE